MMHNINDDDEEDDADVMPDFALLEEILSKSSLQAILEFIPKHNFDGLDSSAISADESTAFIAYTPADIDVITQTYNRLLHAENNSIVDEEVTIMDARNVSALEVTCEEDLIINLINDGIIRINNVLSTDLCDELLLSINQKLAQDIANNVDMSRVTGYGNVLCRDNRWDLYLNVTDDVNSRVLCALFGDTSSNFGNFIRDLFNEGNDEEISVEFHEWSSLISEIGASSQPIHPDSQFTADCPMYTFFIALQDITNDMGTEYSLTYMFIPANSFTRSLFFQVGPYFYQIQTIFGVIRIINQVSVVKNYYFLIRVSTSKHY